MKIVPICLLTAFERRKFKLFGDSSQVRAIDNEITCCYWSASLSNRLRALKAHNSLFKCCEKNCPNYMYWIQGNIVVLESGYLSDYLCNWNWFLLSILIFNLFLYMFMIRGGGGGGGGGGTSREKPQGRKVTLAGPKSDIAKAEKSHKGQNVTLECYNSRQLYSEHIPY